MLSKLLSSYMKAEKSLLLKNEQNGNKKEQQERFKALMEKIRAKE